MKIIFKSQKAPNPLAKPKNHSKLKKEKGKPLEYEFRSFSKAVILPQKKRHCSKAAPLGVLFPCIIIFYLAVAIRVPTRALDMACHSSSLLRYLMLVGLVHNYKLQ